MQILIGSFFSAYAFQKTWANQNLHSLQSSKVVPSGKRQENFGRTLDPKTDDRSFFLLSRKSEFRERLQSDMEY